jgi:uroporphyrinogen decarboxylase
MVWHMRMDVCLYIDILGKNGGYILMASQVFESDVPIENIDAIYKTNRN